jgi:formiminoglutamase
MEDALWPRASTWLASNSPTPKIQVIGVPAHQTSISPTNAHETPDAIREALSRYSTYSQTLDFDIQDIAIQDLGNIPDPDFEDGEARVFDFIQKSKFPDSLLLALGGDNSITHSVMNSVFNNDLSESGLITFDAHHDVRDGISNGSPVQRLIDKGLDPKRIVQIGIADFSNSPEYSKQVKDLGITVIKRSDINENNLDSIIQKAISIAGSNIYVDIDVDVCDRSMVPACPAAAPGGISANALRTFARLIAGYSEVQAIDITEIDATNDSDDQRTVRLAALLLLEIAASRGKSLRR